MTGDGLASSTVDRMRRHLVGLKMARALEVLDHTMRKLERDEIGTLERAPDYIGADMGSIDPGPYHLGSGELATGAGHDPRRPDPASARPAQSSTSRSRCGTAGSAGAAPHLEKTRAMCTTSGARTGCASGSPPIPADMPRQLVREAVHSGRVTPIDSMAPLSEADIDEAWSARSMRRPLSLARGTEGSNPSPSSEFVSRREFIFVGHEPRLSACKTWLAGSRIAYPMPSASRNS